MASQLALDTTELVLVFVLVCRALGYQARLVVNLAIIPVKPPNSEVGDLLKMVKESKRPNMKDAEEAVKEEVKETLSSKLTKAAKGKRKSEVPSKAESPPKVSKSTKAETLSSKLAKAASEKLKTEESMKVESKVSKDERKSGKARSSQLKGDKEKGKPEKTSKFDRKDERGKSDHEVVGKTTKGSKKVEPSKEPAKAASTNSRRSSRESSKKASKALKYKGSDDELESEDEDFVQPSTSKSCKLAAAVLKRKSTVHRADPSTVPGVSAGTEDGLFSMSSSREEEMLRRLEEKYPHREVKQETDVMPASKKITARRKSNSGSKSKKSPAHPRDYWAEVFLPRDKKWTTVDLLSGKVGSPGEVEAACSRPLVHVLTMQGDGFVRDVTMRYAGDFLTQGRKLRTETGWLEETMAPYKSRGGDMEEQESRELEKKQGDTPLPASIGQFKDHPLYALGRHLLKFEAIYPPEAPTLGFIKGEPVYARECVRTLNGRTHWLKEGRTVKLGETPYKVVKARPKWDRMTGSRKEDEPLETFGEWQTELYKAPPAKDGKVPRNEYGNVELFKPWMLPEGTTHIPINGMNRVIRYRLEPEPDY